MIAGTPWWPAAATAGPAGEILGRLWRYSVAVSIAARRLRATPAIPIRTPSPRAGLLCRLGCWAVAAVEPEWLVRWWHDDEPDARRQREIADLGTDLDDLGRRLAERWGCDPLVVDAAWLHGDHGPALHQAAVEPARLAIIQEAADGPSKPRGHSAIGRRRSDAERAPAANPGGRGPGPVHGSRSSLPTPLSTKSG